MTVNNSIKQVDGLSMAVSAAIDAFMETNLNRAVPDIRDGLKPVQRRILQSLVDLGAFPTTMFKKSARVTGDTMGRFHPHGDASIYEALINMSQPWRLAELLVEVHGNNGNNEGDPYAAQRYTESRLSPLALRIVTSANKKTINMVDNYDGSEKEPEFFPSPIPMVLLTAATGIGMGGIATDIPPYNAREVMDLAIAKANNNDITVDDIKKIIKAPDFPTGCDVYVSDEELTKIITTGKGKVVMRAVAEIIPDKKEPMIRITRRPYGGKINTNKMIKGITNVLMDSKWNVERIGNLENLSSNVDIQIVFKKGTDEAFMQNVLNMLYATSTTKMQANYTINQQLVNKAQVKPLGIAEYIDEFIKLRRETLTSDWSYELEHVNHVIDVNSGLLRLNDKELLEQIIEDAHSSTSKDGFILRLKANYGFSDEQAKRIADIRLHALGKQNFGAIQQTVDKAVSEQTDLQKRLSDYDYATEVMVAEFVEIRDTLFKDSVRRSRVTTKGFKTEKAVDISSVVPHKEMQLVVKTGLQAFRTGVQSYNNRSINYTEKDIILSDTVYLDNFVALVTKRGHVVTRQVNDLIQTELESTVDGFNKQFANLRANDSFVTAVQIHDDMKTDNVLVLMTKKGYGKAIRLDSMMPKTSTNKYKNTLRSFMKMDDDDEIVYAKVFNPNDLALWELVVELIDPSKKQGYVTKKINLERHIQGREDGLKTRGRSIMKNNAKTLDIKSIRLMKL